MVDLLRKNRVCIMTIHRYRHWYGVALLNPKRADRACGRIRNGRIISPAVAETKYKLNSMKKLNQHWLGFVCGAALLAAGSLNAAEAKAYQVTGPVLEVTPTTITVQKGNDKWELTRNSSTKVSGDLKVGAKVTIYYTMVATEVEVKDAKGKKEAPKK